MRWVSDPQLSPDGSKVAWAESWLDADRDEPVSAIHVGVSDASSKGRPFTAGPHDFWPRWSPDGRYLAYLSAADSPPALKLAPLTGGVPVTVAAPGPVKAVAWSPQGNRLVLVVNLSGKPGSDPESARAKNAPRVIRGWFNRLDGAGWLEGRDHLFLYDVESEQLRQLTSGDYDHAQPSFSPDGSTIVFVSDRSRTRDDRLGEADLWTIPADGRSKPRRVVTGVAEAGFPSFSPDGAHIAFTGLLGLEQTAGRDSKLLVIAADGSGAPELVAPGLDRPVAFTLNDSPFVWLSADELAFTVADRGSVHIRRARLGERTARSVVAGDRQVAGLSVARGGGRELLAFSSYWADSPHEVNVIELGRRARQPVQLSRAGAALSAAVTLIAPERFSATAPDGRDLEYFVIRPKGRRELPPLFLEIHGGPHLHNPIGELLPHYQGLAAAGYAVVLPNPRGSTGYGGRFTALARGDWGEGPFADVLACADDAIARGLADKERQFVGGYSYGGYMSSWAVGHTNRFRAAAIGAPVVDTISHFGTGDGGRYFVDALDGDPWTAHERLRAQSPVTYADSIRTPVMLYVNEGDLRCPPGQADELFAAIKWHGGKVEYVRYPGGSHLSFFPMLGPPSQNEDRLRRIIDWCARHGGAAA